MSEKKIVYEIEISIDLGIAIPSVGELANSLNTHLAKAGFLEKLSIVSKVGAYKLTSSRELTQKEQEQVKRIVEESFGEALPQYDIRVSSIRRQSGNVQQLASSAS